MNTTVCDTTGYTPAYLLFGRELLTVDDVVQDFKSVVHNDNFVAEITPYLKRFASITEDIRERIETNSAKNKKTSKFMPKRDGPYLILTQKSPTSYLHFGKEADHEKLHPHHKINMFQARRLLQQQSPTEPSIPQQELLLQQLIMSPRWDVVGSIGGDCNPP
ncbi:gag-Pol polyprotein [Trichonephila clavipes]|nr:gag-Pol polyprotein [Trichonephila clavipes]